MLEDLIALSHESDPSSRRDLLIKVTDVFIEGANLYGNRTAIIFSDVVTKLLDDVSEDIRQDYSAHIADNQAVPNSVVKKLAMDELEIASPVLEHSPQLTDDDLVDVAQRRSRGHMLSISKRKQLSEKVTDVLVAIGDSSVRRSVCENMGASISDSSYRTLTEAARSDGSLANALSFRSDMPEMIARDLVEILPQGARDRLANLFDTDAAKAAALLGQANDMSRENVVKSRNKRIDARLLLQKINDGEIDINDAISLLARQNRTLDVAMIAAKRLAVPEANTTAALLKTDPVGICVLARMIRLNESTVEAVAKMRGRRLRLPETVVEHTLETYRTLKPDDARQTLKFLKIRNAV